MITTPNHVHYEAALAFLDAGIDVLCDKPLTNEMADADALVDATARTGCVFGVSYVMSCFAMIRQAREIVAAGGVGKINQIHVEFMQDWMTSDDVAEAAHVNGGSTLRSQGAPPVLAISVPTRCISHSLSVICP